MKETTEGEELRDEALERLEDKYSEWMKQAEDTIELLLPRVFEFTSDDIVEILRICELWPVVEPRVLGALLKRMEREELIEQTPYTRPSTQAQNHRRPIRIWRSLL